jgi:hypothetical protein
LAGDPVLGQPVPKSDEPLEYLFGGGVVDEGVAEAVVGWFTVARDHSPVHFGSAVLHLVVPHIV